MKTREDIVRMIEEEDVEFIRLQYTDIFGNLRNIAVTPGEIDRVLSGKFSFDGNALFAGGYPYEDLLYLRPDTDSFVILPWRPQQGRVGKFICDVCYEDGTPFEMDPREILRKAVFQLKEAGYDCIIDPECEFFLFHTDENGNPTTLTHEQAGYMAVGPIDFGENARRDMVLALEEMGFEVVGSYHEKGPGQHEIDFRGSDAMSIADSVVNFKFAVRSVAKRFGLHATFMPKPIQNVSGSGMHLQVSLYRNGVNVFQSEDGSITDAARHFIGGVEAHAKALCAITNPTVNSYKRLGAQGLEAPRAVNWATRGENSFIKLLKNADRTKVELRFPDSSANPYLALAVCLLAGLDGLENGISPSEEAVYPYDTGAALPISIEESVRALEADELVKKSLGNKFAEIYIAAKDREWREYLSQVTEWELNRYLVKM